MDHLYSATVNGSYWTGLNIAYRYNMQRADLATASLDHDYLDKPFPEYWIDSAVKVSVADAAIIEEETRGQSNNKKWFFH